VQNLVTHTEAAAGECVLKGLPPLAAEPAERSGYCTSAGCWRRRTSTRNTAPAAASAAALEPATGFQGKAAGSEGELVRKLRVSMTTTGRWPLFTVSVPAAASM
jgi:hypothetical protein